MSTLERKTRLNEADMASAHLNERREVRYVVPFEIEVSGIGRDGRVFHEIVSTRNVSEWGCGFLSTIEVRKDDIIALRLISGAGKETARTPQVLFQVVRVEREKDGWAVGAWKMDPGDVWGEDLAKVGKPQKGSASLRKPDSDSQTGETE